MHDIIKREVEIDDAQRLIAQGAIRKAFGLEPIDLRMGLDAARLQLQRGKNIEAFRIYAALVLCDPSDPELQVGLANCALLVGENDLALQAASAIVTLAPKDPRGFFFSGRACLALGQIAEAREDLSTAIKLVKHSKDTLILDEAQKLLNRMDLLNK